MKPTVTTFLLAGFLLLAACSKDDAAATKADSAVSAAAPAASQSADEQLQDITQYRLTMDKYDKYLAAQRNIALKMKNLSPAEREAWKAKNDNEENSANQSLDDMARKIESEPMMKSAVEDAGLSPREFVMITMSMLQSGMAAGVLKMRPNDNQDSLIRAMQANPENVKFMQDNEAEITRKQMALSEEMKKLGIEN